MKIFSHWLDDEANQSLQRVFFAHRKDEEAAAKKAEAAGKKVLARHDYEVEPNAAGLAKFMNEHGSSSCSSDLVEEYINTELLGDTNE